MCLLHAACPALTTQAKNKRLAAEEKAQSSLQRTISAELEFISRQAKGQQKKGQARQRRYDDLVTQASQYVKTSQVKHGGWRLILFGTLR